MTDTPPPPDPTPPSDDDAPRDQAPAPDQASPSEDVASDPTAAAESGSGPHAEAQRARRLKYGLNVAVAVCAAVGLTVFINWIAYRNHARFDLTATRRYSLSQQTHKVLGQLDHPYRLVSHFRSNTVPKQRVSDLIDTYGRYSPSLTVEHIDPERDLAQWEKFQRNLKKRYADQLDPVKASIRQGRKALKRVGGQMPALSRSLEQVVRSDALPAGDLQQFVSSARAALTRLQDQLKQVSDQTDHALDQPLPNYAGVSASVQSLLRQVNQNVLAVLVARFKQAGDNPNLPGAVKERLLTIAAQLKPMRKQAQQALEAMGQVQPAQSYDQMRSQLSSSASVVVVGPEKVRVLNVGDMYRRSNRKMVRQAGGGGGSAPQFLGEEQLTGALIGMTIKQPPMVVFVTSGRQPALGRRGQYNQVAGQLKAADFRVEQWNPTGQTSPMGGQRTPPQPPPQPRPGQKTIWVIPPSPPSNPMRPGAGGQGKIASILKTRLARGDAAMAMFSYNPASRFGNPNPLAQLFARRFGITAQLDRVILHQQQGPEHQTTARPTFRVTRWPDTLPITKALGGMQGLFVQTSPLVMNQAAGRKKKGGKAVRRYPLVTLRAPRQWAETNMAQYQSARQLRSARFNKANSQKAFTVAAAAQKGKQRVVVVADPVWASDKLTTYGTLGPGTAQFTGSAFPANSELFVNSIYWLAGLDQMIAASPRTQDIRRVKPISDSALVGYRAGLLGGVPLVILVSGLGVWLVRRRG